MAQTIKQRTTMPAITIPAMPPTTNNNNNNNDNDDGSNEEVW
jgi:hypothetical protein